MKAHVGKAVVIIALLSSGNAVAGSTNCHQNYSGGPVYCDNGTNYYTYGSRIQDNKGDSWHKESNGDLSGTGENNQGEWYHSGSKAWGGVKSGSATAIVPGLAGDK